MNNSGFGEILETGQSSFRKIAKSTAKGAQNFTKTTSAQITPQKVPSDQGTNESSSAASQKQMSDDQAQQFLRDLYGVPNKNPRLQGDALEPQIVGNSQTSVKTAIGMGASQGKAPTPAETIKTAVGIPQASSEKPPPQDQNPIKTALGSIPKDPHVGMDPEEITKIEALRSQLHKEYYESLTKSKKSGEEHVTEKLEREDEEKKMSELEVQKKKPPPIAVQRVQQSAEKFRGVSG